MIDHFIKNVDRENKTILLNVPEGLIEMYIWKFQVSKSKLEFQNWNYQIQKSLIINRQSLIVNPKSREAFSI
jgi:hypothetical protein